MEVLRAALPPVDFEAFHRRELPERIAAGHGAVASPGLRGLRSLAFRLPEGTAFTYRPHADGVAIVPGEDEAKTVVEIAAGDFEALAQDLESAPGLLYAGRVRCSRGNAMEFVRWEPALRALFHGRPIFDPERAELRDRRGAPLDLRRRFEPGSDPEDMRHFLSETGYLLAGGVFSNREIQDLRQVAQAVRAEARPGDRRSWWGRNRRGEEVLCRVTHVGRHPSLRRLYRDPRLQRLAGLSEFSLAPKAAEGEQGVTVLFKNPDMVEGLSDLPWHRDCGMGGHAAMCPSMVVSIYLTPASGETGELRMLPGSWRGSYGFFEAEDPRAPAGIALDARAGDVSLHYGDIMHAAPPPRGSQGPFRTSVLLGWSRPDAFNHRGDESYNDVLLSRDDGQVEHLARVAERSGS